MTGNYPELSYFAGLAASRSAATALVISPRLQNIQQKILVAVNNNKMSLANQLFERFKSEIKDEAPDFYQAIKDEPLISIRENGENKKGKNPNKKS